MSTAISKPRKLARAARQKALELHYTVEQVALVMGVHKNTVRNWLQDKSLAPYVQAKEVIRIPASTVNRFLQEHTIGDEEA